MADAEDGVLRPVGSSTAPISFSFNRTSARRWLAGDATPEKKDFLKTVEGRELQRWSAGSFIPWKPMRWVPAGGWNQLTSWWQWPGKSEGQPEKICGGEKSGVSKRGRKIGSVGRRDWEEKMYSWEGVSLGVEGPCGACVCVLKEKKEWRMTGFLVAQAKRWGFFDMGTGIER